jgi:hypothetical protein
MGYVQEQKIFPRQDAAGRLLNYHYWWVLRNLFILDNQFVKKKISFLKKEQ